MFIWWRGTCTWLSISTVGCSIKVQEQELCFLRKLILQCVQQNEVVHLAVVCRESSILASSLKSEKRKRPDFFKLVSSSRCLIPGTLEKPLGCQVKCIHKLKEVQLPSFFLDDWEPTQTPERLTPPGWISVFGRLFLWLAENWTFLQLWKKGHWTNCNPSWIILTTLCIIYCRQQRTHWFSCTAKRTDSFLCVSLWYKHRSQN